ncbi:MAG TPA: GNAT family N-acetyltransferase [Acidimicrobiia bacterium]|nr:GNAT family N-acetyltransferase [Acidimicrobiia bacterium]
MANLLRVDGSWPGSITISAGWFRARARPWNESVTDPMVRLERGGTEFLSAVTRRLYETGAGSIYSPALYPSATRVWTRAGFEIDARLDVMERALGGARSKLPTDIEIESDPDWTEILELDRLAFEGFWGMSRLGLQEAHQTNKDTVVITDRLDGRVAGYCIVGVQWGTVYLHRIAVRPDVSGRGIGARLVDAAVGWGNATGAQTMVLNVRPENARAQRLYQRLGFNNAGTALEVLRHDRV